MDEQTDEQLLDAYFGGDSEAFHTFYKRHAGRVIGYATSKGLSQEVAVESCQEAFLRLHRFIHKYQKGRPALPWFFTIVHHSVMDTLRQQRQTSKVTAQFTDHARQIPHTHQASSVSTPAKAEETTLALDMLSPEQQSVVRMHAIQDLSFREIATVTGKSEVALRKIFERAKVKLRALMMKGQSHGT